MSRAKPALGHALQSTLLYFHFISTHYEAQMSRFTSLKNAGIKSLLASIGANTGGRKAQLIQRLERNLQTPKLAIPQDGRSTRILSVDMGIKNLAFCVCDVHRDEAQGLVIQVREWKRIEVMESAPLKLGLDSRVDTEKEEAFGPSLMSKDALRLVRDVLWPYNANTIIVERQRFRSGGGLAVQEWTLRVNMLESMIWAICRSLSAVLSTSGPSLWPVSPKQVATFWVDGKPFEDKTTTRSKIEKKQKIDLVRKWLSEGSRDQNLSFEFRENAVVTERSFLASTCKRVPASKASKPSAAKSSNPRISKLDDLADCLLQAAAWCKWEQNRSALALVPTTIEAQAVSKNKNGVSGGKQGSSRKRKNA